MSAKQKLKRALSAIDDARTVLERAKGAAQGRDDQYLRTALSELDDAETYIKRAVRELAAD